MLPFTSVSQGRAGLPGSWVVSKVQWTFLARSSTADMYHCSHSVGACSVNNVHSILCAAAVLVESSNVGVCGGEIETRYDLDPTL